LSNTALFITSIMYHSANPSITCHSTSLPSCVTSQPLHQAPQPITSIICYNTSLLSCVIASKSIRHVPQHITSTMSHSAKLPIMCRSTSLLSHATTHNFRHVTAQATFPSSTKAHHFIMCHSANPYITYQSTSLPSCATA
jgi:hypothetical protein